MSVSTAAHDRADPTTVGVGVGNTMERPHVHVPSFLQTALIIFLIWTAVGVLLNVPGTLMNQTGALKQFDYVAFMAKIFEEWAWAILTPLILWLSYKLSKYDTRGYLKAAILMLFSVPFALLHTWLTGFMLYPINTITWNPIVNLQFFVYYMMDSWTVYCAIIGTLLALDYYKRFLTGRMELERMEKRLLQSHLNTLRMQLEPHFLFNTLNAISSEVVSNPELARDMLEDLGALMRLSLDYRDSAEINLAQETELLEHYLAIQKIRFGERIRTQIRVAPEVRGAMVPCMLLQPLVENAIRHGISKRLSGGSVTVTASRSNGHVEIRVEDDGVGLPPGWRGDADYGLGLGLTRDRLTALYGPVASLIDVKRRPAGGTEVLLRLPLRTSQEGLDESVAS